MANAVEPIFRTMNFRAGATNLIAALCKELGLGGVGNKAVTALDLTSRVKSVTPPQSVDSLLLNGVLCLKVILFT